MTLTIRLTESKSNKGENFNSFMKSFFKDFSFEGWPYILGGSGAFKGTQVVLLDNMNGRNTKMIVIDGKPISYDLAKHVLSGSLTTVRLGTLGNSYKESGEFTEDSAGRITNISAQVQISGLAIAGTEFHSLVYGLMGSASSERKANPAILNAAIADEAHNLIGSKGNDKYTGTRFSDRISGKPGNDTLVGGRGNDRIKGDAGKDKLTGGTGADDLWGGYLHLQIHIRLDRSCVRSRYDLRFLYRAERSNRPEIDRCGYEPRREPGFQVHRQLRIQRQGRRVALR